jgi:hypothetical protein
MCLHPFDLWIRASGPLIYCIKHMDSASTSCLSQELSPFFAEAVDSS